VASPDKPDYPRFGRDDTLTSERAEHDARAASVGDFGERSRPAEPSGHVWERTVCKHRPALVCVRCGYVLKLSMLRPTRDCRPVTA
jgi:hypothetical protein